MQSVKNHTASARGDGGRQQTSQLPMSSIIYIKVILIAVRRGAGLCNGREARHWSNWLAESREKPGDKLLDWLLLLLAAGGNGTCYTWLGIIEYIKKVIL